MSVIIAVAYDEVFRPGAPVVTWQELKLAAPIPAHVASTILPQFQRWRRFVEPVFAAGGDIVGIRISSLMSPRLARRLRAKVEPFLKQVGDPQPAAAEPAPGIRILSLSKHGLCVPARNVARAKGMLERLADIELQYDADEENVVALLIPPGVSLDAVYSVLEIDVVTVEPSNAGHRRHLLSLLYEEIEALDAAAPPRP